MPVWRTFGVGGRMSNFGWTYLSRDALRQAERQLSGAGQGVRDEIGFLIIHQRYADFFFPGTSVLHTRLRYALFVPWIYQTLYEDGLSTPLGDRLQRAEIKLAGRLRNAKGGGTIGGLNYPKPTSQPASVSYWAALATWGILRGQDGQLPSRRYLHGLLQSKRRKALDDDGQVLSKIELPFTTLPPRPAGWLGNDAMEFDLLPREAEFLREQLAGLCPINSPKQLSLLARLTTSGTIEADSCWEPGIAELAKEDGPKLLRAGHAASLAAIGRAVYAALVEALREDEDRQPTSRLHRDYLPIVIEKHGSIASRTSVGDLLKDTGSLPTTVIDVLDQTITWLRKGAKKPMTLRDTYEYAECSRKQQRARLSRLNGASRRIEWKNDEHAQATPLHYRWDQVSRLLHDLWAAS